MDTKAEIATQHEDIIHDAQLDYYGRKLATCSSDRTIKVFDVDGTTHKLVDTLKGHDGPVWQVSWAHPKFGTLLASCGYDGRVVVWKETAGQWQKVRELSGHSASVNSIAWCPHEFGLSLAAGSSDGKISIHTCKDDGQWDSVSFPGHSIGVTAVSWAPSTVPGSLIQMAGSTAAGVAGKRLASGGCDNNVKIWSGVNATSFHREENGQWKEECILQGHQDWVRDVAWAPSIGLPGHRIASCSQDKTVLIWSHSPTQPPTEWVSTPLRSTPFGDVVWRVSWSAAGNVLAVASGDNRVSLWKEGVDGSWEEIGEAGEGQ
ncbi:WD40 repeat-like protein [Gonapodya prolifera JEL478]|uniref:WD40 repeat-like protein n=1 Tax=Gonapodya prolifera (strain JEL478) TaxID=1344416 RepID=A0A139A5F8_GONPJ|nr:WD40 repeat-like protein [Gonapodya prolifera JEL478]|eukprot:KXS11633.1 WD40 repeat-like protein [Gonapodya prolifera JEL478]